MLPYTANLEFVLVALAVTVVVLGVIHVRLRYRHLMTRKALERIRKERNELRARIWSEKPVGHAD